MKDTEKKVWTKPVFDEIDVRATLSGEDTTYAEESRSPGSALYPVLAPSVKS